MPIIGIMASANWASANASSFESIATATGTGSSNTISFTSIPSGYKALQLRYIAKATGTTSGNLYNYSITFNGSTSSYAYHYLYGNNSTVTASGINTQTSIGTAGSIIPNSSTGFSNRFGVGVIDIIDYTSTSKTKTLKAITAVDVNATASGTIALNSGLWYATPAAITQIDLVLGGSGIFWTTTSSFALYGIK